MCVQNSRFTMLVSGVHLQEVTATISKDLVYEFFGKGPFKCECNAWSPRGKAKSQPATVEVACKYKKQLFIIFFIYIGYCGCFYAPIHLDS